VHSLSRRGRILVVALSLTVASALAAIAPAAQASGLSLPKVETRNLYLGADLTPSITAMLTLAASPTAANQAALLSTNACTFQRVVKTDFPTRAKALAKEIDKDDPVLIGLQEVAIWRSGTLGDPAPATTVQYDFLQSLLSELSARGLHYAAVRTQQEFEFESPASVCSTSGYVDLKDERLTMRDVILARTDIPSILFKTSNPQSGNYSNAVSVSFPNPADPPNPIVVKRGWTSIDVSILGIPAIRFVNTHLESFSAAARFGQAAELLATPALNTNKAVILVGDLNSDPAAGDATLPPAGAPDDGDAFRLIASAGHFSEAGNNTANTCCNQEDLLNPTATFTQRIDHILTRPNLGGFVSAHVIGNDASQKVFSAAAGGSLWASDHGGLVAGLTFP
jgi:endonuclease/exonuclease/phosphatase family metal-dependent hydrolase